MATKSEFIGAPFSTVRMVLTALFVLVMMVGAILSPKIVLIAGYALPGGIFIFPLTYVIVTIMAECYGMFIAWRLIFTGVTCLTIAWFMFSIIELAPSAPCCIAQGNAFNRMYHTNGFVLVIVDVAFLLGQATSLWVFNFLKRHTSGRLLWMRYCGAPMLAQIVVVAIATPFTYRSLNTVATLQFLTTRVAIAVIFSCVMLPAIYATVIFIRIFERKQVFNPNRHTLTGS